MLDAVKQAHQGLCDMIASGELSAGAVLPSEATLCERFSVSRSSLREAQKMLTVAGVLESRRGARARVSSLSPENVANSLSTIIPLLPLDTFLELFTLREVLEGYCAAQAAARMSAASKQHLLDVAHHLAQIEPGHEAQILDSEYHELLVAGAEDRTISALLKVLRKRGRDYHIYESVEHVNLKAISDAAHIEIAQAIQRSDPHLASLLAAQHIETTRSWLIEYRPEPQLFE